jgi:hypothetical protein
MRLLLSYHKYLISCKAVDNVIMVCMCWCCEVHRGSPNSTSIARPMVVIGYSRKWLHRPEVNIELPHHALSSLTPRQRHMLRFSPIVGHTSNPEPNPAKKAPEIYQSFAH